MALLHHRAKGTRREALGRAPSAGLHIHLLPLLPELGASCSDGSKWQTSKALTTEKETRICEVLACQSIWFLLNKVSYGHNRNLLSIFVCQRTWVRIKCNQTKKKKKVTLNLFLKKSILVNTYVLDISARHCSLL